MSDIAATRDHGAVGWLTYAAIGLAVASAAVWVLAGVIYDGLYVFTGVLGVVAFGVGLKARRDDRRAGSRGRLALTAMVVGGFLGAAVIGASVVYGVAQLV